GRPSSPRPRHAFLSVSRRVWWKTAKTIRTVYRKESSACGEAARAMRGNHMGFLSSLSFKQRDRLYMVGLWKHVHDRGAPDSIAAANQADQVPGVGRRLAADVDQPLSTQAAQLGQGGRLASRPRRIEDDGLMLPQADAAQLSLDLAGQILDAGRVDPRVEAA